MEHDGPENTIRGDLEARLASCLVFTIHISKYRDDETHVLVNTISYYFIIILVSFHYFIIIIINNYFNNIFLTYIFLIFYVYLFLLFIILLMLNYFSYTI